MLCFYKRDPWLIFNAAEALGIYNYIAIASKGYIQYLESQVILYLSTKRV